MCVVLQADLKKIKLAPGEVILQMIDDDLSNEIGVACGEEDFTFYLSPDGLIKALAYVKDDKGVCSLSKNEDNQPHWMPEDAFTREVKKKFGDGVVEDPARYLKSSIDAVVKITCQNTGGAPQTFVLHGRANVAKCFGGKQFGVTVRPKGFTNKDDNTKPDKKACAAALKQKRPVDKNVASLLNLNPEIKPCGHQMGEATYLYDLEAVCRVLGDRIFDKRKKSGLIVISGSTGGGKSQVALGLVWQYLKRVAEWKRRPHLVMIEDPIEKYFFDPPANQQENRARGFDYTPRNLKLDVASLKQALRDAKRMMPAVVFIGETREAEDWREVVDFAGSGHLVITTTHAGSLVETIQRIFKAINVGTPAERGYVAKSILAAVNLDSFVLENTHNACVPAIWLNGGEASLVSDGLASVVPSNPAEDNKDAGIKSCLGRHWFAKAIRVEVGKRLNELHDDKIEHQNKFKAVENFWQMLEINTMASDLDSI